MIAMSKEYVFKHKVNFDKIASDNGCVAIFMLVEPQQYYNSSTHTVVKDENFWENSNVSDVQRKWRDDTQVSWAKYFGYGHITISGGHSIVLSMDNGDIINIQFPIDNQTTPHYLIFIEDKDGNELVDGLYYELEDTDLFCMIRNDGNGNYLYVSPYERDVTAHDR